MAVTSMLFSCKKDDKKTTTPQATTIVGSWTPTAITSDQPYEWEAGVVGTDGFTYRGACTSNSYVTFT